MVMMTVMIMIMIHYHRDYNDDDNDNNDDNNDHHHHHHHHWWIFIWSYTSRLVFSRPTLSSASINKFHNPVVVMNEMRSLEAFTGSKLPLDIVCKSNICGFFSLIYFATWMQKVSPLSFLAANAIFRVYLLSLVILEYFSFDLQEWVMIGTISNNNNLK